MSSAVVNQIRFLAIINFIASAGFLPICCELYLYPRKMATPCADIQAFCNALPVIKANSVGHDLIARM